MASPLGRGLHRRGRRGSSRSCLFSPGAADRTGVRRQVFPDVGFNGTPLLDDVGATITLDFLNDDPDLPRPFFSARWTGYWYAPEAGEVEQWIPIGLRPSSAGTSPALCRSAFIRGKTPEDSPFTSASERGDSPRRSKRLGREAL